MEYLEWLGYLASVLVLVSMLMTSVTRLRVVNLIGSAIFSVYGFLIGALPVGFLNMFVVFANMYHLYKLYFVHDNFKTIAINGNDNYLNLFFDYYKPDIEKFFPAFDYKSNNYQFSFMVLRNMAVAGIFLATDMGNNRLLVSLDYVISNYRDLKPGKYIYNEQAGFFIDKGYKQICAPVGSKKHNRYLVQMGFKINNIDGNNMYVLDIVKN